MTVITAVTMVEVTGLRVLTEATRNEKLKEESKTCAFVCVIGFQMICKPSHLVSLVYLMLEHINLTAYVRQTLTRIFHIALSH